jgi:hypothetical protein
MGWTDPEIVSEATNKNPFIKWEPEIENSWPTFVRNWREERKNEMEIMTVLHTRVPDLR